MSLGMGNPKTQQTNIPKADYFQERMSYCFFQYLGKPSLKEIPCKYGSSSAFIVLNRMEDLILLLIMY